MSGLAFSSDVAEKLIAAYRTPDLERQRDETLRRLDLKPGERLSDLLETEERSESFFSLNRYFFSVEKT
jgi:hypothetical protein